MCDFMCIIKYPRKEESWGYKSNPFSVPKINFNIKSKIYFKMLNNNKKYEIYLYIKYRHKKGWVTLVTHPNKQTD